ncbi:MAG TPA: branched-chain amino acid ABC transporter permease [Desulfobacterales bacterium]|nr:branched-chain amino acid ABC transporter permease [Desulfobacterales bacterium]
MEPFGFKRNINVVCLLILAFLLVLLAFFVKASYYFLILNIIGLNTMVVVGLNLLIGYAGQISMGHAAFYGMGAYLSALLTSNVVMSMWSPSWVPEWFIPWIAIGLAMLFTGAVAYLIGVPTLKLRGNYLVMATLGFNIIFEIVLVEWDSVTGGANGMPGIPCLAVGDFLFNSDLRFYCLVWGLGLLTLIVSFNLVNSRVGRALKAIHGSEVAANTLGINAQKYKVRVFVLSAMFASLAGSLYAHYITVITPKSCDIMYSIQVVIMVIVGGMGSVWGCLFGATLLTLLSEVLHVMEKFNVVALGLILMVVMIFFPEGLIPGFLNLIVKKRGPTVTLGQRLEPESRR